MYGQMLRDAIDRHGLQRQWLAEQMGVAPSTVSRWQSGELFPGRAQGIVLAQWLQAPELRAEWQREHLRRSGIDPDEYEEPHYDPSGAPRG